MYRVASARAIASVVSATIRGRGPAANRTVVLLGLTSMLTDISSEMVAAILPIYLVFGLQLSPVYYGFVDGLYQGVPVLVRTASGFVGDRSGRLKDVAVVGYGISALSRAFLLIVQGPWTLLAGIVALDRFGKGIRTAPRDAMISLASDPRTLASSFGLHRAMDTFGAMIGPLIAFALLMAVPRGFDAVFMVSFLVAIVGVAVIAGFVHEPRRVAPETGPAPSTPSFLTALRVVLRGPSARVLAAGTLLGLATVSDSFLYLILAEERALDPQLFPLLFFGTALVYMLLAVPMGVIADRTGRRTTFLLGYVLLGGAYAVAAAPAPTALAAIATIVLLGAYYAMTDGVLAAIASRTLPPHLRATGLGVVMTGVGLARLASSVAFGAAWTLIGPEAALVIFGGGLVLAVIAAMAILGRFAENAVDV